MKKLLLILLLFPLILKSQSIVYECDRDFQKNNFDSISAVNIPGFNPIISTIPDSTKTDHSWFRRKMFEERFILFNDSNFNISIDPILDLRYGKESNRTISQNTRGIILQGQIEKQFFIRTEFYENQIVLPSFADSYVDSLGAIPGMIRTKDFGDNGYDYGMVFGQIVWSPTHNYALRLGYDRFHIGNGYRSMILSDASTAYAFLSNTFQFKKWTFSNMISPMRNADFNKLNNVPQAEIESYQQKWFSLNLITWTPQNWINLSWSEMVMFTPYDSTKISFYPMSLLPVPGIKTALYETHDKHHVINALSADFAIKKDLLLYSQFIFDEIKTNRHFQGAMQIGGKWTNPFGLEKSFLRGEFNFATDNAYSSESSWTSMTHTDQALAHPQGQDFAELLLNGQITLKRYFARFYASYLKGSGLPYQNYFGEDNNNDEKKYSDAIFGQLELGWYINPKTNFQVFGGIYCRKFNNKATDTKSTDLYYQIGLRHSIRNQYYDFF